jgi:proline dehydrogenase
MKLWQQAMISLARSERITHFVQARPRLKGLALRFVGGATTESALEEARALRERGISSSLYFLGEYVTDSEIIDATVNELSRVISGLDPVGLDVSASVDPTQLGLMIDEATCTDNVARLAGTVWEGRSGKPRRGRDALMLDMEDVGVTDFTIRLHNELMDRGLPVAVTIQGYLHRTGDDLADLIRRGAWIRLVKGAFAEPAQVAAQRKRAIDSRYRVGMAQMLSPQAREAGCFPAFGTHDDIIIEEAITLAGANGWQPDEYEFEMLFGVRPELQESLVERGHRVRVYLPFGEDWFPYVIRRIGESARNLRFAASTLVRR